MKKIIDSKRYDTDTATRVARSFTRQAEGDPASVAERLYRTPNGHWFLVGGAGTSLSAHRAETFRPMSSEEAFAWLQEHDQFFALEMYFSQRLSDA